MIVDHLAFDDQTAGQGAVDEHKGAVQAEYGGEGAEARTLALTQQDFIERELPGNARDGAWVPGRASQSDWKRLGSNCRTRIRAVDTRGTLAKAIHRACMQHHKKPT
jgi:hypothetical protein